MEKKALLVCKYCFEIIEKYREVIVLLSVHKLFVASLLVVGVEGRSRSLIEHFRRLEGRSRSFTEHCRQVEGRFRSPRSTLPSNW